MAYTNSPLVEYTRISPNRTINRNHEIDTITIHCVVGQLSVESLGSVFASPGGASSNYGIGYDGRIAMYCEEKDRSWCTSSRSNDNRAITIEVASDRTHPYAVTERAYNALIKLCADICKRNGITKLLWKADEDLIGEVDKQNMTVHRWFESKSCPGDFLYSRHDQIAAAVNQILGVEPIPVPTPSSEYNVGDIVEFTGSVQYVSSTSTTAYKTTPGYAKITVMAEGAAHPYHLRACDVRGNYTKEGVYGWVDAADIKPLGEVKNVIKYVVKSGDTLGEIAAKYNTTYQELAAYNNIKNPNLIEIDQIILIPTDEVVEEEKIKVGDKVRMQSGAPVYGTSTKYFSWVYSTDLYVRAINKDRVTVSTVKTGPITGDVDIRYLTEV